MRECANQRCCAWFAPAPNAPRQKFCSVECRKAAINWREMHGSKIVTALLDDIDGEDDRKFTDSIKDVVNLFLAQRKAARKRRDDQ